PGPRRHEAGTRSQRSSEPRQARAPRSLRRGATAMTQVLVIDVGTSGIRAAVVGDDGSVTHEQYRRALPTSPMAGLVEFDPAAMATTALDLAARVLNDAGGHVDAVGIASQRASTIVWDRSTGEPVGPGIGWQDLRTVGDCLVLQG